MENKVTNDPNLNKDYMVERNKLENAKKEGQTKGALTAGIIGLVVLILVAVLGYSHYSRQHKEQLALMENQRVSFTQQLSARDSMINGWLATFDEIEKNLTAIKQKENLLTVKASDTEFSKAKKDQILEDIKSINNLIETNKKKIAQLNAQLKKSGSTITGLQTRIAQLETSMQQYETQVSELKATLVTKDTEIEQLNTRVYALNDTVTFKNETITNQTNKLNQAFFTYGTFKDLKAKGLLTKEGGFLGLGRTEALAQSFPDSLFTMIDVRQTKTIPVNSKEAKLITEHPAGSYEMVRQNETTIAYIEIKDPSEFWKISKYAVVEIK